MTALSLTLVTVVVALVASLSSGAAAPREHERVVYPPDGGLSRPIIGKKVPTTVQTVSRSDDDIDDEIDSYLQNPHNEKHIFRKKPSEISSSNPEHNPVDLPSITSVQENTKQDDNQFPQVSEDQKPKDSVPNISRNPESTSENKPDPSHKQQSNYDTSLTNSGQSSVDEKTSIPISDNSQKNGIQNAPSDQGSETTQQNIGSHQTNILPEQSYYSNLGNLSPQLNKQPIDNNQDTNSNNATPEIEYAPNKQSHQENQHENSGHVVSGLNEQSPLAINHKIPTVVNSGTNHIGNDDQIINKPEVLQNQPQEQQNQYDYNNNKVQPAQTDHNTEQHPSAHKPEGTPLEQAQNPSQYDTGHKHEEPQPNKETETQVRYDGSQLWKIPIDEIYKIRLVNNLALRHAFTTWGGNRSSVDVLIAPENLSNVSQALAKSGIPYQVIITDLQKAIENENPPLDEEQLELQNRNGHRLTWVQYHRTQDIHGFLDYLAVTYPQICRVQSIGRSHEGRDLKLLKISNGRPNNKAAFIDGGIHAREWISPATVTYIINHIVENYDTGPEIYRSLDWYFLPVVNPDGYEYTHTFNRLWRKNRGGYGLCPGVDLNRNFGFKWGGKGTSSSPCSDVYRGTSAFSEPESKAIKDFILGVKANFKLYASYHSYGQFILYPWGYEEISPVDDYDLKSAGNKAAEAIRNSDGTHYTVGTSSKVLYASAGGSDDWAKAIPGIKYSYTIELPDTGKHGFVLPAAYILRVGKASLKGLEKLAEAAASA